MKKIIKKLIEKLFGHKYYGAVLNKKGTNNFGLSCFIFYTKKELEEYIISSSTIASYIFVESFSFRSKSGYKSTDKTF
jgi:hypothetical protein